MEVQEKKMKIVRADEMGFCYGVARAADIVEELIEDNKKIILRNE